MDLPDPGMKLGSHALWKDSLPVELPGKPIESQAKLNFSISNCAANNSELPSTGGRCWGWQLWKGRIMSPEMPEAGCYTVLGCLGSGVNY